ncbi:hypothetical protein ABVK25_004931 [Lepraria finkii]|uniref:Uncharacterized protein n=1 Tax=Lepraria finkii TaxID=1340010 RepID=A0ABR4B9U4_9LECA
MNPTHLKKGEILPNGGSSKKYRIARTSSKYAKRRIDGALEPVDANIRRRQLATKKAPSNRVSKAPQKSPALFPSLQVWKVEVAGQTDFNGRHKEQDETGVQERAAKVVSEVEGPSAFLGAVIFERQPIQRSLIFATNNRQVGPTHMKEPSKHATKAAEKAWFHAAYAIADPSWTIFCSLPQGSIQNQFAGEFSSHYIYHASTFGQRASCWLEGVADIRAAQDARDRTGMCSCQNSADGLPEQTIVVTRTGFDLAKRWREQLSLEDGQESTHGWLRLFDDVLWDFIEESYVEQYRKRPLPLRLKIEVMAWIFQALPPNRGSRGDWPTKQRQHRCIMVIGSAILTTMEAMIK